MSFALVFVTPIVLMMRAYESVLIYKVPLEIVLWSTAFEVVNPEFVLSRWVTVEFKMVAQTHVLVGSWSAQIHCMIAREGIVIPGVLDVVSCSINPESVASTWISMVRRDKCISIVVTLTFVLMT